jgi:predicted NBD/HSP70 family sugar kinase
MSKGMVIVTLGTYVATAVIANRELTISYGASGTQTVDDTVSNWRNVAPCSN